MAKRQRAQPGGHDRKPVKSSERAAVRSMRAEPKAAPSPPIVAGPAPQAVTLFERGMQLLQRHQYSEAQEAFRGLLTSFPAERALLDRARVYLLLCERELKRQPPTPTTVEERVTAATAALNNGEDLRAEKLARSVLADQPHHDLALYLLAAIDARRGERVAALGWLQQAIAQSPDVRAQARHDADFDTLWELDAFRQLIDGADPTAGAARRRRTGAGS